MPHVASVIDRSSRRVCTFAQRAAKAQKKAAQRQAKKRAKKLASIAARQERAQSPHVLVSLLLGLLMRPTP